VFYFTFFVSEIGSYSVAQTGLELTILLPQPAVDGTTGRLGLHVSILLLTLCLISSVSVFNKDPMQVI
jgi:hypothetical protein